jgi:nicotinate-nucleotide--dimethylbenzimidazole phosphoribosyltransferase
MRTNYPLHRGRSADKVSTVNAVDVDLDEYAEAIGRPDLAARSVAEQTWHRVAPLRALGRVQDTAIWLTGVQGANPPREIQRPRLLAFAGDHGIASARVSVRPAGDTARRVHELLDGTGVTATLAEQCGVTIRVLDLGVADELTDVPADALAWKVTSGTGRIDRADAMTLDEAEQALRAGIALADAEVDEGADLLIPIGIGVAASTPASALVAALIGSDAAAVTGRGSGIDDNMWMRKCAAIRDTLRRARPLLHEPVKLLAACTGPDLAALTGFLLQAARRRTPVLIDGVVPAACALLAQRMAFRIADWLVAGNTSQEPAYGKVLDRLSLEPLRDDQVRGDDGVGALLAVPLLRAASNVLTADDAKDANPSSAADPSADPAADPVPEPTA